MTKTIERIAGSKALRILMVITLVLSTCACIPANAFAAGEDAGSWTLNIHSYSISGGVGTVNGGVGYASEDGDISYCYDWNAHGPSADGQEYTHMKRGTTVTDYIVAKGYPNTTNIAGHDLSAAEAQAATQLAAWLASDTMGSIEDHYGSAPSSVKSAAQDLYDAAAKYEGGDDRIDGMSSILFVDGQSEIQPMLTGNMFGRLSLTKVSSNTDITAGNELYDLDGVRYGVFTDEACTQSYHDYHLTMDESHNASLDLVPGTYYVKETTAPEDGTYVLDTTVYKAKVQSGKTTAVNGGSVSDMPQSNPLSIVLVKHDSDTGSADVQGDAEMAGAEFTVKYYDNDQGSTSGKAERTWVLKTDSSGQVKLDGDHLVSGKLYTNSKGQPTMPVGTYTIQETKAPTGYLLNDETHVMQVRDADGRDGSFEDVDSYIQVSNLKLDDEGNPLTEDDVIRGGVRVTKSDVELQESEAIGGADHSSIVGPNLNGIEFTITNASAQKVKVGDAWYEPGKAIETITTSWDEELGAYVASTPADELPYGTYTIQETKTNDSYLLTDGTPKTFQVREEGMIVTATSEDGELTFYDQVVRNDLKLSKKADSTSESLQVPFLITNVTTGESHVLVTDRNGQASTASSWNRHSANTNGNDALAGAEDITADDMDTKAGIWFALGEDGSEAPVNDALAALPYGEYTLTELRCEANEGYELITKKFWIERDSGAAEAVWMTIDDQDGPKVQTEATDGADGDHTVQRAREVTVVDTVYYENLTSGEEYTLNGTLMVKSTGEALLNVDGSPVTATKTFTANAASGSVELEFTFDGSLLAGEDVVAFESLVHEGVEVAAHADIDDEGQTVHFLDIGTSASDSSDGDKLITGSEAVVTDTVTFTGLVTGTEYVLDAVLMNASTGEAVKSIEGSNATGTLTFTAEEADGSVDINLAAVDTAGLGGRNLVVFETLSVDGTAVAVHKDLNDKDQTVIVCEIGTTLTDATDGDHVIESGKVKLTDTVEYKGLTSGETYTVHGTIIVKGTGEALENGSKPVTATAEFSPEGSEGTVEVTFEFDASDLAEGTELVAFEECLDVSGNIVAVHQDLEDEGQTVTVDNPDTPETPDNPGTSYDKTGTDLMPAVIGIVAALAAACALAAYGLRKRRSAKAETENEDVEDTDE